MGFTSFAAERTRDWKLRQMAPVEWTTSFLGTRCRSITSLRDCFLPMSACKSCTKLRSNDGNIQTDEFHVSGQLFSFVCHRSVHFLDYKIDRDVRISAKGPGVVLTPVDKLFEY